MKRIITLALALCLTLTLALPAAAAGQSEAEQVVRALGIMVGDQNGDMNLSGYVTRAQYAKMLAVAAGQGEAAAAYAPFRDVPYTHWAAGYIKTATDSGWFLGYIDGTFRPDGTILLEEAATAALRMLGYTEADYSGLYPQAQLAKAASLDLLDGVSASQGQALTRQDCMVIFYNVMNAENKQGQVHAAARGYSLNTSGAIDAQSLLLSEAKGPYVAQDAKWTADLPFTLGGATIYLNGKQVDSLSPAAYDVYYYNGGGATLWVYTDRAVGIYTAAAPGQSSPETVTVAGVSYAVGDAVAARKLSSMGQFAYGDAVALLLGMDGKVVDVVPADSVDGLRYGLIVEAGMETYQSGGGTRTDYMVTIIATDGGRYSYLCDNTYLTAGSLVSAGYENGMPVVKRLGGKSLTGKVTAAGAKIGSTAVAPDACILEITTDGTYQTLYPTQLASANLKSGDVRFYATDAAGAVTHLIVEDVTGDLHQYGILTASSETEVEKPGEDGMSETLRSGEYAYITGGKGGSLKLPDSHLSLGAATGPAMLELEGDNPGITLLGKTTLATVGTVTAQGQDGQSYAIADTVQVYIETGGTWYLSQLSSVTGGDYTLYGYYDSGFSAGGKLRIIIAK